MGLDSMFKVAVIVDLMDRVSGPMKNIEKSVESVGQASDVFRKIGAGMAAVGVAVALTAGTFVDAAAQAETYKTSLTVMLGSVEMANQRFEELSNFAAQTPFELPQVVTLGNQLQALGRYSQDTMTTLGDLAAAAGKPIEQVTGAFAKLASGQKGIAVDMFRDLLISTSDWVKYTGKGVSRTGELMATTEEMLAALPRILAGKGFAGMMDQQSKTFKGVMSNLSDSIFRFKMAFGEGLLAPVKGLAKSLTGIIDGMNRWAKANPQAAQTLARLVGVLSITLVLFGGLIFLLGFMGPVFATFTTGLKIATAAWRVFSLAMTANPIGLIIAAVALLGVGLYLLITKVKPVRVFFINLINGIAYWIGFLVGLVSVVWGKLNEFFGSKLGKVVQIALLIFAPFIGIPLLIIRNFGKIVAFFKGLGAGIVAVFTAVVNFFRSIPGMISGFFGSKIGKIVTGIVFTFAPFLRLPLLIVKNFKSIVGFFQGFWNALKEGPRAAINFVINAINSLIERLNGMKIKIPLTDKVISFNIPKIPSFASGVENFGGGLAYVHQDELVSLPRGASVHTKRETRSMLAGQPGNGGGTVINHYRIIRVEKVEVNADDIRKAGDFITMMDMMTEGAAG